MPVVGVRSQKPQPWRDIVSTTVPWEPSRPSESSLRDAVSSLGEARRGDASCFALPAVSLSDAYCTSLLLLLALYLTPSCKNERMALWTECQMKGQKSSRSKRGQSGTARIDKNRSTGWSQRTLWCQEALSCFGLPKEDRDGAGKTVQSSKQLTTQA